MGFDFVSASFSSSSQIDLLFESELTPGKIKGGRIKIKHRKRRLGIEDISLSGNQVSIDLEDAVKNGSKVKIIYKDKKKDEKVNVFQNLNGRDSDSFKTKISFYQSSNQGDASSDGGPKGADYDALLNRKDRVSEDKGDYVLSKEDLSHPSFAKTDFNLLDLSEKDLARIDTFYNSKIPTIESRKTLSEIEASRKERGITGTFGHTDVLDFSGSLLMDPGTDNDSNISEKVIATNKIKYNNFQKRMDMFEVVNPSLEFNCQRILRLLQQHTSSQRFSWADWGMTPPVKNQNPRGYCWAFATLGVLESSYMIRNGYMPNLSEMQYVDLVKHQNTSISGNAPTFEGANAFNEGFFHLPEEEGKYKGLTTESVVPYDISASIVDDGPRFAPKSYGRLNGSRRCYQ